MLMKERLILLPLWRSAACISPAVRLARGGCNGKAAAVLCQSSRDWKCGRQWRRYPPSVLVLVPPSRLLLKEGLQTRLSMEHLVWDISLAPLPGHQLGAGYDACVFSTQISNLAEAVPCNDLVCLPFFYSIASSGFPLLTCVSLR